MRGIVRAFNGLARTLIVRAGASNGPPIPYERAYQIFLSQITKDFGSLPDVRELTATEIRFFYDAIRAELEHNTTPRG